ncbi:MAG: hypothetical protein AAB343_03455 [Patescibacteria group bacterium]
MDDRTSGGFEITPEIYPSTPETTPIPSEETPSHTSHEGATKDEIFAHIGALIAERTAQFQSAPYASVISEVRPGEIDFLLDIAFKRGEGDAGAIAAIDAALAFKNQELVRALHEALTRQRWAKKKQEMH